MADTIVRDASGVIIGVNTPAGYQTIEQVRQQSAIPPKSNPLPIDTPVTLTPVTFSVDSVGNLVTKPVDVKAATPNPAITDAGGAIPKPFTSANLQPPATVPDVSATDAGGSIKKPFTSANIQPQPQQTNPLEMVAGAATKAVETVIPGSAYAIDAMRGLVGSAGNAVGDAVGKVASVKATDIMSPAQAGRLESVFQAYGAGTDITIGAVTSGFGLSPTTAIRPFAEQNIRTGLAAESPAAMQIKAERAGIIQQYDTFQKSYDFAAAQNALEAQAKANTNAEGKWAGSQQSLDVYNQNVAAYNARVAESQRLGEAVKVMDTKAIASGAFVVRNGQIVENPENARPYGALSDYGRGAENVMLSALGTTREQLAAYEVSKQADFAKNPLEAVAFGGFKEVVTRPENVIASGISGVQFAALSAGVGEALNIAAGGAGVGARAAGAVIRGGESLPGRVATGLALSGAGFYSASEGFTLPTTETAKNIGAMGVDVAAMTGGAIGVVTAPRVAEFSLNVAERGVSAAGRIPSFASEKIYQTRQRMAGIENIGPSSGLSYVTPEDFVVKINRAPSGVAAENVRTTPSGEFAFVPDEMRYANMERIFNEPLLLKPTFSEALIVPERLATTRVTTTGEEFSFGKLAYSQVEPSGRTTVVEFDPVKLMNSGYVIPTEAFTTRPAGGRTVTRTENLVINPYTGTTVVRSEAVTRFTPSVGKSPIERSMGVFNIYDLKPSILGEGEPEYTAFPAGAVNKLVFESGTERIAGVKPAFAAERIAGEVGSLESRGRTFAITPEGVVSGVPERTTTIELSRAIADIIGMPNPEQGVITGYMKANPSQIRKALEIQARYAVQPIQPIAEESAVFEAARQFRAGTEVSNAERFAGLGPVGRGGEIGEFLDRTDSKKNLFGTMDAAKAFRANTEARNAEIFRGLQYEERPQLSQQFKETMSSIQRELAFRRMQPIPRPVTPKSQERAMVAAKAFNEKTIAANRAREAEMIRRFEESQRYVPSEIDTGKIIDTTESIRRGEAMMKVYKQSEGEVFSRAISSPVTAVKERGTTIRPIDALTREIFGVGEVGLVGRVESSERGTRNFIDSIIAPQSAEKVKSMDIVKTDFLQRVEPRQANLPEELQKPLPIETPGETQIPAEGQSTRLFRSLWQINPQEQKLKPPEPTPPRETRTRGGGGLPGLGDFRSQGGAGGSGSQSGTVFTERLNLRSMREVLLGIPAKKKK